MPALWTCIRCRGVSAGGIVGYPLERVYQEVAYLGSRVHWTHEELLNLDHAERQRWLREVLKLEEAQ
jgi:hypothetical protein